jgi:hypothetical protein
MSRQLRQGVLDDISRRHRSGSRGRLSSGHGGTDHRLAKPSPSVGKSDVRKDSVSAGNRSPWIRRGHTQTLVTKRRH